MRTNACRADGNRVNNYLLYKQRVQRSECHCGVGDQLMSPLWDALQDGRGSAIALGRAVCWEHRGADSPMAVGSPLPVTYRSPCAHPHIPNSAGERSLSQHVLLFQPVNHLETSQLLRAFARQRSAHPHRVPFCHGPYSIHTIPAPWLVP